MADNDNHPDDADPGAQPESEPTPKRSRREPSDDQAQERARGGDAEAEQPASAEEDADKPEDEAADSASKSSGFRGIRLRELSGPQACLTIVGCGTLAALLVVALIYGGIRMIASSFTGDESGHATDGGIPPSGEPIDEVDPGQLDLCERGIPSISGLSVQRADSPGESYVDTVEDPGEPNRVVSDECSWELMPTEYVESPWEFNFSYQAILSVEDDENDAQALAEREFSERDSQILGSYSSIDSDGASEYGDESQYAYGVSGQERRMYHVLVRDRGAVYSIVLESEDDPSKQDFEVEARKIAERVSVDLSAVVPN